LKVSGISAGSVAAYRRAMAEFLVELFVPLQQLMTVQARLEAASEAAEEVSREGNVARYVRSIVMPEDETCFLLYEATSIEAVRAAVERVGLDAGRITETLVLPGLVGQPARPDGDRDTDPG
jgi:hypothetical protein